MNPPNKQVLISSTHLLDLSISVILLFFLKFLHSYMHLLNAGIASETSYLFFYSSWSTRIPYFHGVPEGKVSKALFLEPSQWIIWWTNDCLEAGWWEHSPQIKQDC